MPKYKVIALSVGTKHGVKHAGDFVTEADFPAGHVSKMVDGEFIEEIKESKKNDSKKDTKKK